MGKRVLTAYERAVEEGVGIGRIEGKLEGEFQKAIETARRMKQRGFSKEEIIEITVLSLEDLERNGLV
jgi:predicted transposase/invertase (TIGR01784 family)